MTESPRIAPGCLRCGRAVRRARGGGAPKRGWRIVGEARWTWFCSRQCSGKESGERNTATGLLRRNLFPAAQARYAAMVAKRRQAFLSEADWLRKYGVPRDLAVNLLERVYQTGVKSGRDRAVARMGAVA